MGQPSIRMPTWYKLTILYCFVVAVAVTAIVVESSEFLVDDISWYGYKNTVIIAVTGIMESWYCMLVIYLISGSSWLVGFDFFIAITYP